ncbi:MAG: hypothetical protein WD648_05995 [Planctomycetaceae bacterium]
MRNGRARNAERGARSASSSPRVPASPRPRVSASRHGSVLLIVLVIIVLLSLGVYTFTEVSLAELEATNMFGRGIESRTFADSGIDVALTVLGRGSEHAGESFYHRPDLFQGVVIKESDVPRGRGRFSIVAPVENDATMTALRFGLVDESAKLNLNALDKLGLNDTQSHFLLMSIPGMTDDVADAILDWLDSDMTARFQGAENEYYQSLPQPYTAANGDIGSLDELLLVRGVTPELLYGEDTNQNGLIEPQEDDGDGIAELGWSAYFSVFGRESNTQLDGTKKINVNGSSLIDLFDQLEKAFDSEVAKFVIGFRMSGDRNAQDKNQPGQPGSGQGGQPGSGNQNSPGGGGNSSGGTTESSSIDDGTSSTYSVSSSSNQDSSSSSNSSGSGNSGGGSGGGRSQGGGGGKGPGGAQNPEQAEEKPTRGGIDLSAGAKIKINSLYDLVGAEVEVTIDGEQIVLTSPWTSSPSDIRNTFPTVQATLSTNDEETIEGRINAAQARREVLLGLPEMTEQIADAIVGASPSGNGQPEFEVVDSRTTNGWLLAEGILTLEQMRKFDKYFTAKGDIYRLITVGYFEAGGPVSRLEAVIDTSEEPPLVMFVRDLSELGKGYAVGGLMGSSY